MEQDDGFQSEKLNAHTPHRTYLVAYSQADSRKVPSRKDFRRLVKSAFNKDPAKSKSYIGPLKRTRTMASITISLRNCQE